MEPSAHLAQFRSDAAALAAACRLGTQAPVPSCPGWDVADLVEHLGRIHRWVLRSLAAESTERVPYILDDDPAPGNDVAGWYEARAAELLDRFATVGPHSTVATFVGPQPAAWWMRRQAHETAVHRWDAQRAHSVAVPIEAELASDGIDEFLTTFLPRFQGRLGDVAGTVHIHCTDVDGEWFLRFDDEKPSIERIHAKGDVAARGGASELLLMTWGRVPTSAMDVIGDRALLERLLASIRVG
ncbi:MAG: maleylpyruvate isomerase family mycothiol-dependent enzyme [Acidimicrobiales bacterium]